MLAALAFALLLSVTCLPRATHQGGWAGDGSLDAVLQHVLAAHGQNRARFDDNIRDVTIGVGGRVYNTPITQNVADVNRYADDRMRQHWSGIREYVSTIQNEVPAMVDQAVRQLRSEIPATQQNAQLVQHNLQQINREAANYVGTVFAQLNQLEDETLSQLDLAYDDVLRLGGVAIEVGRDLSRYQEDYLALFETTRNLVRHKEKLFWQFKTLMVNNFVKRAQLLASQIQAIYV